MNNFLFLDFFLGLLLIKILSRLYSTVLSISLTSYLVPFILGRESISLIYLILYAAILCVYYSFIGIAFTGFRILYYPDLSILKIGLFFLIPNFVISINDFFGNLALQNSDFQQKISSLLTFLCIAFEHTFLLFLGGILAYYIQSFIGQHF